MNTEIVFVFGRPARRAGGAAGIELPRWRGLPPKRLDNYGISGMARDASLGLAAGSRRLCMAFR